MKTLEELKAELAVAQAQVWDLESQIQKIPDGYTYHICIRSYGSVNWEKAINTHRIQWLCNEYQGGYDGLVDVYTDNPDMNVRDLGCLTQYTLDELPESRRNISKSQGMVNMIAKNL